MPPVIALLFVVTACESHLPPGTAPSPRPTESAPPAPNPPAPSPPLPSTDPIVGRYTLNLALGSECASLPEAARTRTYAASIDPAAGGTGYVVTLAEASFLSGSICNFAPSGLGCNQFLASRSEDVLRFDLINENDDGHGGHIVERIPPGTWMELIGSATGRLQDGGITATGSASIWYCPTNTGYPFPCNSYVGCKSDDLRLTFTRR
jgi:hypothetical protein